MYVGRGRFAHGELPLPGDRPALGCHDALEPMAVAARHEPEQRPMHRPEADARDVGVDHPAIRWQIGPEVRGRAPDDEPVGAALAHPPGQRGLGVEVAAVRDDAVSLVEHPPRVAGELDLGSDLVDAHEVGVANRGAASDPLIDRGLAEYRAHRPAHRAILALDQVDEVVVPGPRRDDQRRIGVVAEGGEHRGRIGVVARHRSEQPRLTLALAAPVLAGGVVAPLGELTV